MILHLSYVMCDGCHNVITDPTADGADEARAIAKRKNQFARTKGKDLCPECQGMVPSHDRQRWVTPDA